MVKRCPLCGGELRLPTDLLATPLSRVCAVCGRLTEIPDDVWQYGDSPKDGPLLLQRPSDACPPGMP